MNPAAYAGYLVDTLTGEVIRELRPTLMCRGCGTALERGLVRGRQPERCTPCAANRRRAADRDRKAMKKFGVTSPQPLVGALIELRNATTVDRYLDGSGQLRQLVPYGTKPDHGADEGSTLAPDGEVYALIYGKGGLRDRAMSHPWFAERPGWWRSPDFDSAITDMDEARAA